MVVAAHRMQIDYMLNILLSTLLPAEVVERSGRESVVLKNGASILFMTIDNDAVSMREERVVGLRTNQVFIDHHARDVYYSKRR